MRIWGWLIVGLWLSSLAGLCVCAATEHRDLGNRVFAPLAFIAFGQTFLAMPAWAIGQGIPVEHWRKTFFRHRYRVGVYTRQENPYRYWFAMCFFIAIGCGATALGVWLLVNGNMAN